MKSSERKLRVLGVSQIENLAQHFRRGRSISPMEARTVFGIERLAARVHDLRRLHWKIKSAVRMDAKGARYMRYSL